MKDNDLLVTELYKDPNSDPVTAISVYLTPKTSKCLFWLSLAVVYSKLGCKSDYLTPCVSCQLLRGAEKVCSVVFQSFHNAKTSYVLLVFT